MVTRFVAAVAALAALTGMPAAPTVQAAAAAAQAPTATRDFLLGRWTDNNDCSNIVEFLADGRFVTSGGAEGRWSLVGDRLTFQGNSTVAARVAATGPHSISLTHDDGSVGYSTRCPSERRLTMPQLPANAAAVLSMSRPIGREHLIGTWTDDGNCSNVIRFAPDGQFTVPGGGTGRWTLNGENLSFIGERTVTARVRGVGRDRILLIHEDQSIGQSLRC